MDRGAKLWDREQDSTTGNESTHRNAEFGGLCEIQVESALFKQDLKEVYTMAQIDNFKFTFYVFSKHDLSLWATRFRVPL